VQTLLGVGLLALAACGGGVKSDAGASPVDRDWELVALGGQTDPVGAGGRPITLRLDAQASRAAGFGGCNRYSGGFELAGASLKFGAMASTKMACDQGMDVEDRYLPALGAVQGWKLAGGELVLEAAGVAVLRFREAGATP
jgi:putative lipoprotein